MQNKVIVKTTPINLSDLKDNSVRRLKHTIAKQDLEVAQKTISRELEDDFAVHFNFDIILILSINIRTLKIKIDYSKITCKNSVRILRLYLSGERKYFISEWLKLS